MTEDRNDTEKPRSAQAEVMAKLKAKLAAGSPARVVSSGDRFKAERAAAARSASKSKPQLRK